MTIRIAASFLAIFATGLIVAPAETKARAGGLAGARGMPMRAIPFHGGFRAPIARPAIAPVRPAQNAVAPARINAAPFGHFRHRRFFGGGLPVAIWGDVPWYSGGYYDSPSYVPPYQQPIYTYPTAAYPAPETIVRERIIYVLPPRPSCSTQTYRVPAQDGGVRSINVVRC
jgi:hypothetical protein